MEPYQVRMKQLLEPDQVYAVSPLPAGAATRPKVLRNDPRRRLPACNLVASAMRLRRRVEADFALTNSLGIRADSSRGRSPWSGFTTSSHSTTPITAQFLSGDEVL